MPAEKKITKDAIVNAATDILRAEGMGAVNARSVAKKLGCTTKPIYLSFASMGDLKKSIEGEVNAIYQDYLSRELKSSVYPPYKAYGMGYIKFAKEEKLLFEYLFMRDRTTESKESDDESIEDVISTLRAVTELPTDTAKRFHLEMWIYVHGIATMLATGYLEFDETMIGWLVSDMYIGLKSRYGLT